MSDKIYSETTHLILAGGRGQRMGGIDKGLMHWQSKPLIEHIITNLDLESTPLIISANRNLEQYKQYSEQVINDELNDFQGPLAGILSAMHICKTPYILCVPCDSPEPPAQLLEGLWQCMTAENKNAAICHDGDRLQPLFSLISCQHKQQLELFLQQGRRKVHDFFSSIDPAICDFSTQAERFHNFNHPQDIKMI